MKKKHRYSFFINLFIALAVIVAVVVSAYFALDKWVVPKYFKEYGIENMHDLVGMVQTLYKSPKEKDIVKNGFTLADQRTAVNRLIKAGVPSISNTELDYKAIANGLDRSLLVEGDYKFNDREIASILDQMLQSGVLASKLVDLRYLNTINISVLDLIINPQEIEGEGEVTEYSENKASVFFNFKLDTSSVREQIASMMDTPLFLLNMIVPKTLYIAISYELEVTKEGKWLINNGHMAVNGRTEKDSEILLNLLIKFIFKEEDQMTIDKFTVDLGNIFVAGLEMYGNIHFYTDKDLSHGVVISL